MHTEGNYGVMCKMNAILKAPAGILEIAITPNLRAYTMEMNPE